MVSMDNVAGGEEEFVVMDRIKVMDSKFVLIAEEKSSTEGRKRCLLAMKDAWDNNDIEGGLLYMGSLLQEKIGYDGISFSMTEKLGLCLRVWRRTKRGGLATIWLW